MLIDAIIWSFVLIVFVLSSYYVGGQANKSLAIGEKVIATAGALFIVLYYGSFLSLILYVALYALTYIVVSLICKRPILRHSD